MLLKSTPEYTKEKDTDRDRALYLCRQLERELTAETEARKAGDRRISDDQQFIAALQEKITHLESALAATPNAVITRSEAKG